VSKSKKVTKEDMIKDRLAYIGTLASGLAHEINNPLNSISLNIDLLSEELESLPNKFKKSFSRKVKRIKGETDNLQKILGEFLAFARPPRLEAQVLDINDLLYDIVEFLDPELKKKSIIVKFDLDDSIYPIMVDPRQLHQVFINLLKNALEAIDENKSEVSGVISIKSINHEGFIEVRVSDNGEGIPTHFKDKIFEVFFTTKSNGTGLGLGIVSRIVGEHQGTLTLLEEDEKNGLTTFVVTLPKSINLGFEDEKDVVENEVN